MNNNYDDIINMKYQKSQKRPHIPISDRAAQFAPYAALTGYDEKVKEEAKENNSEQLEVNIAKHRNGETTKFYLAFEANTNACMNYANVSE